MKCFNFVAAIAIVVVASAQATAGILASDDFSYADGSLVPNGGWATHSGTPGDLLVSSGAAVVQHGDPSEDANLSFLDVSSGVLTATFDIMVTDDTEIGSGGTDFEYFAHFFTDGSFNFRSRVDVVAPSSGGDYTLGISSTSSTAEATLPVDFDFGETVAVSIDFDLDTGIGSLTVGANTIVGTSSSLDETLNRFALRQSDSSNNETVIVDNLRITGVPVPEPSTILMALMAASAVGAVGLRRKLG
jgi:hypothetical protein